MDKKILTDDELLVIRGLRAAQRLAHKTAKDSGWYTDVQTGETKERNFGEVVALMHSELSEALEADRKDLTDEKLPHRHGVEVEFTDCLIRILDTAESLGYDMGATFVEKNRYNQTRSDHKIENRSNGGKKY